VWGGASNGFRHHSSVVSCDGVGVRDMACRQCGANAWWGVARARRAAGRAWHDGHHGCSAWCADLPPERGGAAWQGAMCRVIVHMRGRGHGRVTVVSRATWGGVACMSPVLHRLVCVAGTVPHARPRAVSQCSTVLVSSALSHVMRGWDEPQLGALPV